MTKYSRGAAIPDWERQHMIFELKEAMRYIRQGMREQRVKDNVLNILHTEIIELTGDELR